MNGNKKNKGTYSSWSSRFKCNECGFNATSAETLRAHTLASEKCANRMFSCKYCSFQSKSMHALRQHQRTSTSCIRLQNLPDSMAKIGYSSDFAIVCSKEQPTSPSVPDIDEDTTQIKSMSLHLNEDSSDRNSNNENQLKRKSGFKPSLTSKTGLIHPFQRDSDHKFLIDVSMILEELHTDINTIDELPHDGVRDSFYADILRHAPTQTQLKKGVIKNTFRNIYNLVWYIINDLKNFSNESQSDSTTTVETIDGYQDKYSFSDVCELDVYNFLINCQIHDEASSDSNDSSDYDSIEYPDDGEFAIDDFSLENKHKLLKEHQSGVIFSKIDVAMLDLHNLLKSSGAPLYLFDSIIKWCQKHSDAFSSTQGIPISRETFINNMSKKVYGPITKDLKPTLVPVELNDNNSVDVPKFDVCTMILTLLNNEELMHHDNLLLDPDDPYKRPPQDAIYDDLNTGSWVHDTSEEICTYADDILFPIELFSDAGNCPGNHSCNPLTMTIGFLKRELRNKHTSWRTVGYIESFLNAANGDKKSKKRHHKLDNYHRILDAILEDLKRLVGPEGGFRWNLKLKGKTYPVNFKVSVQLILGDCQGLDKLCGHFGGHHQNKKFLCRDCKVPPHLSDDPYHKCVFITKQDVFNKTEEELNRMSIHPIRNSMYDLYCGANNLCVHECTPIDPLHQFLYGIVQYLVEVLMKEMPSTTMDIINRIVKLLYKKYFKQSDRHYPDLSAFQNGIDKCNSLSATHQYGRLFAIYCALSMPEAMKSFCMDKRKVAEKIPNTNRCRISVKDNMGTNCGRRWYKLIESTLLMYQFIIGTHPKSRLDPMHDTEDHSLFQNAVRSFMADYKQLVVRDSQQGLRITKFHQLLHYAHMIRRHGSARNFDTGRCESIAVNMYKRSAKNTQRRQATLNSQIATRYVEELVMDESRRLFRKQEPSFRFTNDERYADTVSNLKTFSGSKYFISFHPEFEQRTSYVNVKWNDKKCKAKIDNNLTFGMCKRLFLNDGDGGCLTSDSVIECFTEYIDGNGNTYRAHPDYRGSGAWYDWCQIKWKNVGKYPAKILCFFDLSKCTLMTEVQQGNLRRWMESMDDEERDEMMNEDDGDLKMKRYIKKGKYAVICSGLTPTEQSARENQTGIKTNLPKWFNTFSNKSKICSRMMIDEQIRMVNVESIVEPVLCLPSTLEKNDARDNYFLTFNAMSKWQELVLDDEKNDDTEDSDDVSDSEESSDSNASTDTILNDYESFEGSYYSENAEFEAHSNEFDSENDSFVSESYLDEKVN